MNETRVGPFLFKLQGSLTLGLPSFTTRPLLVDESGEPVRVAVEGAHSFLVVDHRSHPERPGARVEFWTSGEAGEGSLRGLFVFSDPLADNGGLSEGWTLAQIADLLSAVPVGV